MSEESPGEPHTRSQTALADTVASGPPDFVWPTALDGIRLGEFDLGCLLGSGGMGAVYRALHRQSGQLAAVKLVKGRADDRAHRMFRREVQAHARLTHRHIVHLFDYGVVPESAAPSLLPGTPFVAMELATRGTLREAMPLGGWEETLDVALQVLDGLAFAHARRVIHRDLKPENLLVFDDGLIKIGDFGIAHAVEAERVESISNRELSAFAGTPAYSAPEQIGGRWREYDAPVDIYALACVVFELVSGAPPFRGDNVMRDILMGHVQARRPRMRPMFPVPGELQAWLDTAMAIDPHARFQRAADAAWALRRLTKSLGPSTHVGTTLPLDFATGPTLITPSDTEALRAAPVEPVGAAQLARAAWRSPTPASWRASGGSPPARAAEAGLGLFGLRDPPFVDRDAARDIVWQSLIEAERERCPRVVVIAGESGTGKTRLAEWMAIRAYELGVVELFGASHSPTTEGPREGVAGLVVDAVRGWGLGRREFYEHVRSVLGGLAGEREESREIDARALTELVYPDDDGSLGEPHYRFSSTVERGRVVGRTIQRVARGRVPLINVDDAQWGATTLDLLDQLIRDAGYPLLVLITARASSSVKEEFPAHLEAWAERDFCRRVDLEPLAPEDHRSFIDGLLPLDDRLAAELTRRTQGNPLFAIGFLSERIERGLLVPGASGLALAEGTQLDLPDDIHRLWMDRLTRLVEGSGDGLASARWEALELAAALGFEVSFKEWVEVSQGLISFEAAAALLADLVDAGLAFRRPEGFAFVHRLLVESVERRAQEAGRRAAHHRMCAAMLERIPSRDPARREARRAEHLIAAGELEEAVEALRLEIPMLQRNGELRELCVVLERVDSLLDQLDAPLSDHRRLENAAHTITQDVASGAGDDGLLARTSELIEQCEAAGATELLPTLFRARAFCHSNRGEMLETSHWLERAAGAAVGKERVVCLRQLGWTEMQTGNIQAARARFREAREAAGTDPYLDLAVRFGELAINNPEETSAIAQGYEELRRDAHRTGFRNLEAVAWLGLGESLRWQNRPEEARPADLKAVEILEEIGASMDAYAAHASVVVCDIALGLLDEAHARLDQLEAAFERSSIRAFIPNVLLSRLAIFAARHDWAQFDAMMERVLVMEPQTFRAVLDLVWLSAMASLSAERAGEADRAALAYEVASDVGSRCDEEWLRAPLLRGVWPRPSMGS